MENGKSNKKSNPKIGLKAKLFLLFVLFLLNTLTVVVVRESFKSPFCVKSAVLFTELAKFVISFVVLRTSTDCKAITKTYAETPKEKAKIFIVALIYSIQNILVYISVKNLETAIFQVLNQLKIISTAFFSVLMLSAVLSRKRWISIFLLVIGVSIVQIDYSYTNDNTISTATTMDNSISTATTMDNPISSISLKEQSLKSKIKRTKFISHLLGLQTNFDDDILKEEMKNNNDDKIDNKKIDDDKNKNNKDDKNKSKENKDDKKDKEKSKENQLEKNFTIGFWTGFCAAMTSGFAGVFFEKMLKSPKQNNHNNSTNSTNTNKSTKSTNTNNINSNNENIKNSDKSSLWQRNLDLSFFSVLILSISLIWDGKLNFEAIFEGYNLFTVLSIVCNVLNGIVVSLVIKYADNILKAFAVSLSIVVCALIDFYRAVFEPSFLFVGGVVIVLVAVQLYSVG